MRVLTWNILHGGGPTRIPEIALAMVEQRADLVVLTEFRTSRGGQIRGVLADHGLVHQIGTEPKPGKNGLLLASRYELERLLEVPPSAELSAKWLAANVNILGGIAVLGVHIPDDSRPDAKALFWRRVVETAREWRDRKAMVVGDLNTGRHYVDEPGATFGCVRALGEMSTLGYTDAWRSLHPGERQSSWGSCSPRAGFRVDAVLVSEALLGEVVSAEYGHLPRERGTSDHSLLVVELSAGNENLTKKEK